jgi:hypothetical protein
MPVYHITETKPAIQRWEFTVTADSEEEALHKVMDGQVDPIDYVTDEDPFEGSHYSVNS